MAIEAIDSLRNDLPEIFRDRQVPEGFPDDWIIVQGTLDSPLPDGASDGPRIEYHDEFLLPVARVPRLPDFGGSFPGSPTVAGPFGMPGSSEPPPPDALAFYLPFHYYHPKWWGIYLTFEGIEQLAAELSARGAGAIDQAILEQVARWFLYGHEYFHHKAEAWATRTEIIRRLPLYVEPYEAAYRKHSGTDAWKEEAVATAHGWLLAKDRIGRLKLGKRGDECVLGALRSYIEACPPGYRMGATLLSKGSKRDAEHALAEEYLRAAGCRRELSDATWGAFPYGFAGILREGSRVNYLVHKDAPLGSRTRLNERR